MPMSPSSDHPTGHSEPSRRELADLSALADGSLPLERRDEVEARIASSAELSAMYANERRVVELLGEPRNRPLAPPALRARIDAQRPTSAAHRRRRAVYAGGLAGALAAVLLAAVLLVPSGGPGAPSVSAAAALAARGVAASAPAPDPSAPGIQLDRNIDDVYFPNWGTRFGWTAVGQRVDYVGGRRAVTVFYDGKGKRIAYTIVASPALGQPSAPVTELGGTALRTFTVNGRPVVTWRRAGHTCVLSGDGVPVAVLQTLAAWRAPGDVRS
jgi:hypothetical protein